MNVKTRAEGEKVTRSLVTTACSECGSTAERKTLLPATWAGNLKERKRHHTPRKARIKTNPWMGWGSMCANNLTKTFAYYLYLVLVCLHLSGSHNKNWVVDVFSCIAGYVVCHIPCIIQSTSIGLRCELQAVSTPHRRWSRLQTLPLFSLL